MGAISPASAPATKPNQEVLTEWDKRCAESGFTRWPHGLYAALFRATSGHATAIAICEIIAERTHGAPHRKGGARPEWTAPMYPEDFAKALGVGVRAIQDALAILLDPGLITARPAANRAKTYKVEPRAWETSDGKRKLNPEEPVTADETPAPGPVMKIIGKPLVMMPGKTSRPIPLSDAVLSTLKNVRCHNMTGIGFTFEPVMHGSDLYLNLVSPEVSNRAKEGRSSTQQTASNRFQVVESNQQGISGPFANAARALGTIEAKKGRSSTQQTASRSDVGELRGVLRQLMQTFKKPLDAAFEKRVASALGDAPALEFKAYAEREISVAAEKKGKILTSGILEFFARDFAAGWKDHANDTVGETVEQQRAQEKQKGYSEKMRAETLARMRSARKGDPEFYTELCEGYPELADLVEAEHAGAVGD